jgi:hypothetical protein
VMRNREITKAPVDPYLGEELVDWSVNSRPVSGQACCGITPCRQCEPLTRLVRYCDGLNTSRASSALRSLLLVSNDVVNGLAESGERTIRAARRDRIDSSKRNQGRHDRTDS